MTDFHIAAVAVPTAGVDPGAIRTAFEAVAAIDTLDARRITGHDDFEVHPEEGLLFYPHQIDNRKLMLRAVRGPARGEIGPEGFPMIVPESSITSDDILGGAGVFSSRTGNAHSANLFVLVRDDLRRRGIGSALARSGEQVAQGWGCHKLTGWSWHPLPEPGQETLQVHGSKVGLPVDEGTAFALSTGQELAQVERHSTMAIPEQPFEVPEVPEGYELVQWAGVTPEEFADGVAALHRAMWTDPPMGGMEVKPEPIDAERVLRQSRLTAEKFIDVVTVARHAASGELAGITDVHVRRTHPAGGFQEDTIVLAPHRGRGLGLLLKAANVAHLQQVSPQTRRVHTWNAGENEHMWPINERLGYRTASVGGAWEKSIG